MYEKFLLMLEAIKVKKEYEILDKNVSRETFLLLQQYVDILFRWNKKFNLISRKYTDPIVFFEEQILECINLFMLLKARYEGNYTRIYDIGSGAGLPGIVLSIFGMHKITLIDKKEKKVEFQNYIIRELGLKNIEAINKDIKQIHISCTNNKNIVVSKAVANCKWIVDANKGFSDLNSVIYLMKNADQAVELSELDKKLFNTKVYSNVFNNKDSVFQIQFIGNAESKNNSNS